MDATVTREDFLRSFLGALGAAKLVFRETLPEKINGTVVYDPGNPDERQGFCWHATEKDVPSKDVCRLARLIHERNLLDIDKLTLPREQLRVAFNEAYETSLDAASFGERLDALQAVRVKMIDEGMDDDTEPADGFFVHE